MIRAPKNQLHATKTLLAFAIALMGSSAGALALESFTLENLKIDGGAKGSTAIKSVEVVGSNLSRDELLKLFAPGTPEAEATDILSRLVASRITIPEIIATGDKGKFTISAVQATDIDTGKVGHATIGGFDGAFEDANGSSTVKSGPIALDGAGFAGVFKALKSGNAGSATTHFGHFSWTGLEMSVPDKDTPAASPGGNQIKIKLGSLTADGTADGDVPLKTTGAVKNLTIEMPQASSAGKSLAAAGYPMLDLGLTFSSTYDPAAKTFGIDDLTLSGAGAGSLALKLALGGLDKSLFTGNNDQRTGALLSATASGLELRFVNAGAAQKILSFAAAAQGKTPDAVKTEAAAMAAQLIPAMLGGHPAAPKIASEVSKFIGDPRGLTITAKPKSGSISVPEAMSILDPVTFLDRIDVTVLAQADGAVSAPAPASPAPAAPPAPGIAPAPRAAAPAPAAPPAAAQAPAAPRRLTGAAAWATLLGNSISGKNSDGDPLVEYYLANGTVKQLDDDETATGKWALRGDKICFEFPDDDEESCYTLIVDGNVATFTDEDGAGRRYEVLKGNPKRL